MNIIAPKKQKHWGILPVALFGIVGTGIGLYLTNAILIFEEDSSRLRPNMYNDFDIIAFIIVLFGFALITLDTQRPSRGFRAISNIKKSWISREIATFFIFFISFLLYFITDQIFWRLISLFSAAFLLVCQSSILYRSKSISSWNTIYIYPIFVTSGLISGFGLALILQCINVSFDYYRLLSIGVFILLLNIASYLVYIFIPNKDSFQKATSTLRKPIFLVVYVGLFLVFPLFSLLSMLYKYQLLQNGNFHSLYIMTTGVLMLLGGIIQKALIVIMSGYTNNVYFSQ